MSSSFDIEGVGRDPNSATSKWGAHCYKNRKCYGYLGGTCLFVLIIVLSMSWDTVAPTQFGLLRNTMTGAVDLSSVYSNGRYFVGPNKEFIRFPSNRITLSYGNRSRDDQAPIPARTGAASTGESSGGQPVSLSVSFQYKLMEEYIPQIYEVYGVLWETTYLRLAQQAVTNTAQEYTPASFWTMRRDIEKAFHVAINDTLVENGWATVENLQLRAVGFQSSYEQTIINIQLQNQLIVTKSYQYDVTEVMKEVDLLQSQTDAEIVEINADAARQRDVIVGRANADALLREQSVKATMYRQLRDHLGWSGTQFLQYVKMRALNRQNSGRVTVGVNALGSVAP